MKPVSALVLALGVFLGGTVASVSQASQVAGGVSFEDDCVVAGQPLVLNGVGVRVKLIVKVYALALYLPARDYNAYNILTQPGAKSVHIAMLRDVRARDLSDGLVKGITSVMRPDEVIGLQSRLDDLQAAMLEAGDAKKGDLIQIDYLPDVGARITVGGKSIGHDIPGEDFFQALLKIWLGDNASDDKLRSSLLGASSH